MSVEKNQEELKERLLNARALSDDELEQVSGGAGPFKLLCSNPACYAHTVSYCGATPGDICGVCKVGIIEKIYG